MFTLNDRYVGNLLTTIAVFALAFPALAGETYPGIGRPATAREVAAWDIDVRPDFKGLPKGAGTVAQGMVVWDSRCASCHGTFGESNEVFTPMIGGTTAADIQSGHVATLANDAQPQRTTMMKLSTLSTLWDYINRAMPWNAPKSLTTDEVYAVTAYILNMAEVLPDDFQLSERNIVQVQQRLPNRYGMTTAHGMRTVKGKPDVQNTACMSACGKAEKILSFLPDYARNAHGNNAEQNRLVGPVRGANTLLPAPLAMSTASMASVSVMRTTEASAKPAELIKKHGCVACHAENRALVGPSWTAVRSKYLVRSDTSSDAQARSISLLQASIKNGGAGNWGTIPMPAQAHLSAAELTMIARWILTGADKLENK